MPLLGRLPNPLTIDDKCRISIPLCIREDVVGKDNKEAEAQFYVGQLFDPCLYLHTPEQHTQVLAALNQVCGERSEEQEHVRFLTYSFIPVTSDKSGRITIPQDLRQQVDVGDKVMLVGNGKRVEIWKLDEIERRYRQARSDDGFKSKVREAYAKADDKRHGRSETPAATKPESR